MTEPDLNSKESSRRSFLKGLTAVPVAAFASGHGLLATVANGAEVGAKFQAAQRVPNRPPVDKSKKFVGIQIGARSFVDEGADQCLDTLQETGGVNVVPATVFTYGTGLAGRQVHGLPLLDHGVKEYDTVHGGSFTRVHPEFYADPVIKDIRAPELGEFDILADVIPKAKAKGMQTYALFEEAYNPRLMANFEKVAEVDDYGKLGRSTCFNNPYARAFLSSMVSDWMANNDLDGLMWESERQGPLNTTLRAHFVKYGNQKPSINCFCDYCIRKAKDLGIDGQRGREGVHCAGEVGLENVERAEICRRQFCFGLANLSGVSGDFGVGTFLVHIARGDVRHHLRDCEGDQSPGAGRLAHHAPGDDESVLQRGHELLPAGTRLGLSKALSV